MGHNADLAAVVFMTMTRRTGLTWVTALTVASLLLGAGALNALAEGHAGGEHGGGQAKPEHPQPQKPAVVTQAKNDGETAAAQHAPTAPATAKHDDRVDDKDDVQRNDHDDNDLVTPPARVTGEDRPGLGCGDDNHAHTGAPGNPDKTCKPRGSGDDDEQGQTDDDANVAGAASQVAAAVDDRDAD